jgi:AcrR family transcriptional regulator
VKSTSRVRGATRNEILRVFTRLIAERGYNEASIGEIASAMDVSKGTVNFHFTSKVAMLEEVVVQYMRRRLSEAQSLLTQDHRPEVQLAAVIHSLMNAHKFDRDATKAAMREFVRFAGDSPNSAIRQLRESYTDLLVSVIERGIAVGSFRATHPDLLALQVFGMCNYAWTWYDPRGPVAVEEIAAEFCRNLVGGIAPRGPEGPQDDALNGLLLRGAELVAQERKRTRDGSGARGGQEPADS